MYLTEIFVYQFMINALIQSAPAVLLLVDAQGLVSHIYITQHSEQKVKYLVNRRFLKLLRFVFTSDNARAIVQVFEQCVRTKQACTIPQLDHISTRRLAEYLQFNFIPFLENDSVIVHIRNITESVLMKEEFTSMSEQYEAVNRELYAAIHNLDFHLMDIEQAHKKIAALYRITSVLQKTTVNEQEVLSEILDGIIREMDLTQVSILLLDEQTQELTMAAHRGGLGFDLRVPLGQGVTGYAALHRELVYVENVKTDPRYISFEYDETVSELAIPLVADDRVLGVLNVETTSERALQAYDIDLLRSLASQIAMTIAHASHVAEVEKQAITDGLTGLYNYRYFRGVLEQEFKRAMRYERPLAMLMLDIDYFKNYNDTNGHLPGDAVLQTIAALLKEGSRDVDVVVRYGGEEFAILLPETSIEDAHALAERLRINIAEYPFENRHLQPSGRVTVSIGISGYPHDAGSFIELMKFADIALYSAKHASRNCTRIYQ